MRGEPRFILAPREKTKIPAANSPIVEGSGAGVGENEGVAEKTTLLPMGESSEPEKSNGIESWLPRVVGVSIVW
jgi:hypothetical protein